MNVVIVGADRLGNIPKLLMGFGIRIRQHISGRASAHQRVAAPLPDGTDLLILFTDFLNHNAMRSFRAQAQAQSIPVLACRRSASCLLVALRRMLGLGDGCPECVNARHRLN